MEGELTVTQFNDRVNMTVSGSDLLRNVSVTGEISELKQASSGHFYLTLKDQSSVLRCTLFRYAASRVPFRLENGMKVTAFGSASYYTKGGSFGFNIESLAPAGKGEQQIALEQLTAKLLSEGLFDEERKRQIPRYPKVIGVVTSPTGAVIKDIIDTTARRYPVDILLSPATVQGADAPASIVSAIDLLMKEDIDVMIVGRGGGSAEDLSAFNDESVVRAVAGCRVPVISAVGHATDKTLCDRAADRYAETPTAAAMIATPDRREETRNIGNLMNRLDNSLASVMDRMRERFRSLDARLSPRNAKAAVGVYSSRFETACSKMDSSIQRSLMLANSQFQYYDSRLDPVRLKERVNQSAMYADDLSARADRAMQSTISDKRVRLESISMKLEGLDPNSVLSRGYSFIKDGTGRVLTSVSELSMGSDITIQMRDGSAVAEIKEMKRDE